MARVVFLKSRASYRGGLEKYTHHLLQAFLEKGCAVTLLTTGEAPLIEGINTLSLAPDTKFSYYQLIRFNALCQKWVKENPQDIIFGMERTTSQTHYRAGNGVHAVFLQRRKMIDSRWKELSFKINPLHIKLLSMEKEALEKTELKKIFTNSTMVRDEILAHFSTSASNIEVVPNGVEWKAWQDNFEDACTKPRKGPYQLLFVGNGYKRKGLLFLLQGLAQLKNEDFHLTVIGKEKRPQFFIEWAKKNGLSDKISFLGPQATILPFYKEADALVIPSIYDPFANVTVEALAMGLFVISSLFNGGKEVLTAHSGTLIEELTEPSSVAHALQKAFNNPKTEERARMIRQSIKHLDFTNQLDKIVSTTLRGCLQSQRQIDF